MSNPDNQVAKANYRQACRTLQKKLREIRRWPSEHSATQTQEAAEPSARHCTAVYVPSHQMQAPLRSADGSTLLADKTNILNRWAEHYGTLFNDVRSVEDASIDNIQQQPVKPELDEPPFLEEVQTAVKKMEVHKAPGIDGLPTEVYKHGGDQLIFTLCRKKGVVPGDLRDAVIVFLYKNKGERSDCSTTEE